MQFITKYNIKVLGYVSDYLVYNNIMSMIGSLVTGYSSVGGAVSIPLVTLLMLSSVICCSMWSVLSSGPAAAARLVNCSISRLFSRNKPHTSSW